MKSFSGFQVPLGYNFKRMVYRILQSPFDLFPAYLYKLNLLLLSYGPPPGCQNFMQFPE